MESVDLLYRLNKSLCLHEHSLYVFKVYNSTSGTLKPGVLYSFDYGSRLASWNTTMNILKDCECGATSKGVFGLFDGYIQSGALSVDLADREVVNLESLVKVVPRFMEMLETKMKESAENRRNFWCASRKPFFALLQKLTR
ncbi:hypothetical protein TSMEX_004970 [Taenia solium]|eukprot:TsM_001072100 transcript=TsM_001072100 gene=TsM_001072100